MTNEFPALKDVLRLPITDTFESKNYCFECGTRMLSDKVRTDKFDIITGNPYQVEVTWCPNWRPSGWFNRNYHTASRKELVWEKYQ
jgi:hypothetical protein